MRIVVANRDTREVSKLSVSSVASTGRIFRFLEADLPPGLRGHLGLAHHGKRIFPGQQVRDALRFPTCVLSASYCGLHGAGKRELEALGDPKKQNTHSNGQAPNDSEAKKSNTGGSSSSSHFNPDAPVFMPSSPPEAVGGVLPHAIAANLSGTMAGRFP